MFPDPKAGGKRAEDVLAKESHQCYWPCGLELQPSGPSVPIVPNMRTETTTIFTPGLVTPGSHFRNVPYRSIASDGAERQHVSECIIVGTCSERYNATQRYVTYVSCQLCPDYKHTGSASACLFLCPCLCRLWIHVLSYHCRQLHLSSI